MPKTITVYNRQEAKEETLESSDVLEYLEEIGLFAAHEMYSERDVIRLMNAS